ncbi:MAG: hypothetical protein K0S56_3820 [Microvirga sp.]|nr:hypothetical protein [Microvirga sp.]
MLCCIAGSVEHRADAEDRRKIDRGFAWGLPVSGPDGRRQSGQGDRFEGGRKACAGASRIITVRRNLNSGLARQSNVTRDKGHWRLSQT